jgi:allophanate hydrolase subunit 2
VLAQLQPGQDVQLDPMSVDQARTAIQEDQKKVQQTLSRIRDGITGTGMHS